jgi:hypothetical protein
MWLGDIDEHPTVWIGDTYTKPVIFGGCMCGVKGDGFDLQSLLMAALDKGKPLLEKALKSGVKSLLEKATEESDDYVDKGMKALDGEAKKLISEMLGQQPPTRGKGLMLDY